MARYTCRFRAYALSNLVQRIGLTLLFGALVTGCASQTALFDYDPAVNFTQYQSFAIVPSKELGAQQQTQPPSSLDQRRIEGAIAQTLQAQGYELNAKGAADAWLSWEIRPASEYEQSGFSISIGFGIDNVGFSLGESPPVKEIKVGRLALAVVDPESRQVVWQAVSKRSLEPSMSPEARAEVVSESVADMLAQYPPDNGSGSNSSNR